MSVRTTVSVIILFFGWNALSQISDDFSDGDLTNGTVWSGDVAEFQVTDQKLNSNGPASTGQLYLATPNMLIDNVVWEFYVQINGTAPSSTNRMRIYLVSDIQNLEGAVNGYYLEIGQTNDDFLNLKRSDSGTGTTILSGTGVFSTKVRVKVVRSASGLWTMQADHTGGSTFQSEGSITDNTYSNTAHFGFVINHTSTRSKDYFIDDVKIDQVRISSLTVNSKTTLSLSLNQELPQIDVENVGNYSIAGLTILSATKNGSNVDLILDETTPLTSGDHTVTILATLTKNVEESFQFSYLEMSPDGLLTLTENQLQLDFNQNLDATSASNLGNYSVDNGIGNPSIAALDGLDKSKVNLTFSNTFSEGVDYQLTTSGLENEAKNSLFSGTLSFDFVIPLVISSVAVPSKSSILISFNKNIDQTTAETVTNFLVKNSFGNPATAAIQPDNKSVLLTFSTSFANATYSLTVSNVADTDGNEINSSGNAASFSYLPLTISGIAQVDYSNIRLGFNQKMDVASAQLISNYTILNTNPSLVVLEASDSTVVLTFENLHNSSFEIFVNNVQNKSGNAIASELMASILFQKPTPFRSILINEIMADPTPEVGQPNAEYVELYNPTNRDINLTGFLLNGAALTNYNLQAKSYLLVTSTTSYTSFFFGLSNAIGQSSFDALTNGGDVVLLEDQFGNKVDSLFFGLEWYDDEIKSAGGYSLELINPNLECSEDNNWTSSVHASGGTPGVQNSVYSIEPDVTGPMALTVAVQSPKVLKVTFDEPMDAASMEPGAFSINDNTVVSTRFLTYASYELTLQNDLSSESNYTVSFSDILDCSGNALQTESYDFYYDITPPQFLDLIVLSKNKIALKFHEILNKTEADRESNFLISGINPTRALLQDSAINRLHLEFDFSFQENTTYMVSFQNMKDANGNSSSLQQVTFTYQDQVDSVFVVTPNLLAVRFTEKPAISGAQDFNNYKTDGQGKPMQAVIDQDDSTLVRLSFEKNFSENKKLLLYVENLKSKAMGEPLITPAHTFVNDKQAPDVVKIHVLTASKIGLTWNEKINLKTAASATRYKLENNAVPQQVEIVNDSSVNLSFAQSFEIEKEKRVSITGVSDLQGNVWASARNTVFIYDLKPPVLTGLLRASDTTLRLTFHEKLKKDSVYALSHFSLEGVSPTKAKFQGPDSLSLILFFDLIEDASAASFSFSRLIDQRGNVANDSTVVFNSINPNLTAIRASSDSVLVLTFSEPMDASVEVSTNYNLASTGVRSVQRLEESWVALELEKHLNNQELVSLGVSNLTDQDGNALQQTAISFTFNHFLETAKVIDDKVVELNFTTDLASVSASQFQLLDVSPTLATLDGTDKSIVRLFFSSPLPQNQHVSIRWQGLQDKYERLLTDYSVVVNNDKLPPVLTEIESDYFGVLHLRFDESLEKTAAQSANLFTILGVGNPVSAVLSNDSVITLNFNSQLVESQEYQLVVSNLPDTRANFLIKDTTTFTYTPPALPAFGDILITEIMADPAPVIGLPEAEYLELFNNSSKSYNLKSIKLVDPSVSKNLPDYELQPGAYMILTSATTLSMFDIPNKVGVSGFPSLGNSSDSLVLLNIHGQLIDQVKYTLDWYGDSEKDDGGFSLELINPESTCFGKANWIASVSETGGTPGVQNSVYSLAPDAFAPSIKSHEILSANKLALNFSEPMDSLSLVSGSYISPDLTIQKLSIIDSYFERVEFTFNENMIQGKVYSITVQGGADCSGNVMQSAAVEFGSGRLPTYNEILISEIMADPDPVVKDLPNAEYIEIVNNTGDLLSLNGMLLSDAAGTTFLASQTLAAGSYLILCPTSAVTGFSPYGKVMGVANWPSLANAGEQLSLSNGSGLIFSVTYEQAWHSESKSGGGYSLELKDLTNPCGGRLVWGSSVDANGGTPGKKNSNAESVPDNFGPELASVAVISLNQIRVTFNELLGYGSAEQAQITTTPVLAIQQIESSGLSGKEFTVTFGEELIVNQVHEITVTNVFDCNGNGIQSGNGKFVRPGAANILSVVLNEVLFDPKTGGVDFVEIYNNSSNYIDLKSWNLARGTEDLVDQLKTISLSEKVIAPGEYLALTSDPVILKSQYASGKERSFLNIGALPTYANDRGTVVLLDADQNIIDQFSYNDDMHSSLLKTADGVSLERVDFNAPTQSAANWASASSTVGFATPGYLNSQSFQAPQITGSLEIEPKVFLPGNSSSFTHQSFTTINYQFKEAGKFANVMVFDQYGRPIKELANGASLSTTGFMRWDGTDNSGGRVRMGYYLVVFEVYDGAGHKNVLKETVVVGR